MTILTTFSGLDWMERIGLTLLHSLWQIALIAVLYAGVAILLQRRSAQLRYFFGCLALFAMLLAPLATYLFLSGTQPVATADSRIVAPTDTSDCDEGPSPTAMSTEPATPTTRSDPTATATTPPTHSPRDTSWINVIPDNFSTTLKNCLPWATTLWIVGVVLLSL